MQISQKQRRLEICKLLQQEGFATIDHLVSALRVTPQTIRRDLAVLAESQLIDRHHGGASHRSSVTNTHYQTRKILNQEEKEKIGAAVAGLIPDHASLFINIGTTTETIAQKLLNHKGLRVVTNNLHVAAIMSAKEDFRVMIAPGEIRYTDGGVVGNATRDYIDQFRMDFGIIGISGIHADGALLDYDDREVSVAKSIIEHSEQIILAADHSKFERSAMVQLGNISQVDYFVTDQKPNDRICKIIHQNKVSLHIAHPGYRSE